MSRDAIVQLMAAVLAHAAVPSSTRVPRWTGSSPTRASQSQPPLPSSLPCALASPSVRQPPVQTDRTRPALSPPCACGTPSLVNGTPSLVNGTPSLVNGTPSLCLCWQVAHQAVLQVERRRKWCVRARARPRANLTQSRFPGRHCCAGFPRACALPICTSAIDARWWPQRSHLVVSPWPGSLGLTLTLTKTNRTERIPAVGPDTRTNTLNCATHGCEEPRVGQFSSFTVLVRHTV